MASKVEIWNGALRAVGVSTEVQDETERSAEAAACRAVYDEILATVLSDYPWPFALRRQSLALVASNPTDVWGASYRVPPEALQVFRLVSSFRPDTERTRIPYEMVGDDSGQLVYTNESPATVEYTVMAEEPERYPPAFVSALKHRLAAEIAPSVTSGDQFQLGQKAMQKYLWQISKAKVSASLMQAPSVTPTSSGLERAREG